MKELAKVCTYCPSLKIINLVGNRFNRQDCLSLIFVAATKGSRGALSCINLQSQIPRLSVKDELHIIKTATEKEFPMKIHASSVPEDVLYNTKLNLQEEEEKLRQNEVFDDTETRRISAVIRDTHYDDTENFVAISTGANCFTKSVYI